MSVRVGSDPLCHMSKPEAGYYRWHQHCHLCVGDRNLQGEGQVSYAQTGKNTHTTFSRIIQQGAVALKTKTLILRSPRYKSASEPEFSDKVFCHLQRQSKL